jgi:hypothetical protein
MIFLSTYYYNLLRFISQENAWSIVGRAVARLPDN